MIIAYVPFWLLEVALTVTEVEVVVTNTGTEAKVTVIVLPSGSVTAGKE